MQKGNIQKLLSYYIDRERFSLDMERATKEFFGVQSSILIAVNETSGPYFNEWLVYDFKLSSGKTLLEDYYERNPHKRPLYEMQEYKDIQNNVYGLLEVLKIDKGEGMEMLVLHTNEKFYVKEHLATFELEKKDLFFNRIGRVSDHYELIGAPSISLGTSFDKNIKKMFYDPAKKYTPMDAMQWFFGGHKNHKKKKEDDLLSLIFMDIEEIIEVLDQQLMECDLDKMINARLIQGWITDLDFKRTHPTQVISSIIFGLLDGSNKESFQDLMITVFDLSNNSPHFSLSGKTPREKSEEEPDRPRKFDSSINKIGEYKSWKFIADASRLMTKQEYGKALEKYEKAFALMKKEQTTLREIYRAYTNLAICHLVYGEIFLAEKCLEISLEMNENYDFGALTKERLRAGIFDKNIANFIRWKISKSRKKIDSELKSRMHDLGDKEMVAEFSKQRLSDEQNHWELSPAREYYEYLKRYNINFKTDELTTTPIMNS